jgi:parvulin-like peptidyl-prolyl isomerase
MALVVNGNTIEETQIKEEMERLRPRYEEVFADWDPEEREAQLLEWSKENVVERVLLHQEVKTNSEAVPEAEIEAVLAKLKEQYEDKKQLYTDFNVNDEEKLREAIDLQMRVERKLKDVSSNVSKPSQTDIKAYYDQHKERFKSGEQLRVAHIVKYVNWQTDEATALQTMTKAKDELNDGAPFEFVVDKYTDCADSGGDLGYVVKGQLVEEFEDVVFNLGVGQVSDIFRTRFGFHIAKVYDRKPPTVPALKEVAQQIVQELQEQMRENAVNEFIDQLKSRASIQEV